MATMTTVDEKSRNGLRVGTCSWTDKTMVQAWYPAEVNTAEARLRYYASHFPTVEVDSSFYALPSQRNARLWMERTPPGFVFHFKAFGMMTRHGVHPRQLPPALREEHEFELDRYGRIVRPSRQVREKIFSYFREALDPLRSTGRLGVVLLQFPPYFTANQKNRRYIEEAAALLAPDPVAVEFRHSSWVTPEELPRTLAHLSEKDLAFVPVDTPRLDSPSALPPVSAATSSIAYVRFHGRNESTWNARTTSAAERFKYLYSEEELSEWVEPLTALQTSTETTYAMFNNCYADYAPRNAQMLLSLLDRGGEFPEEPGTSKGLEE